VSWYAEREKLMTDEPRKVSVVWQKDVNECRRKCRQKSVGKRVMAKNNNGNQQQQ
jgi:hypothetical protein